MREVVFILVVVLILLALTAVRYRRQIVTIITFWKQFQAARAQLQSSTKSSQVKEADRGIKLVNCARCGKWVPEGHVVRHSSTTFVCARNCTLRESKTSGGFTART